MTNPGSGDWLRKGDKDAQPSDNVPADAQPPADRPSYDDIPPPPGPYEQTLRYETPGPPIPPPYPGQFGPPQQSFQGQPYEGQPYQGQGGYPPPSYPGYGDISRPQGQNGMAIASLCVGIAALPLSVFCGVLGLIGIVAVILGVVALNQIKQTGQDGRGLAIGGIVVGGIDILAAVIVIIFFAAVIGSVDYNSLGFTTY
jgi:hypothetical protein